MKPLTEGKILTIDQGNSAVKAVLWNGDVPVMSVRSVAPSVEDLLPMFSGGMPAGCIYSNVGHADAKFIETLRRLVEGEFIILTPSLPLPFSVDYKSRDSLGNDRIAAVAGAGALFPKKGALIVDAGTAITLDIMDNHGNFKGGNISPGLGLRLEALHHYTESLPKVDVDGPVPDFGYDTTTAIRSGVVNGVIAEICASREKALDKYGDIVLVMTGKDSEVIAPSLVSAGIKVNIVPELVGMGLKEIYNYNFSHLEKS